MYWPSNSATDWIKPKVIFKQIKTVLNQFFLSSSLVALTKLKGSIFPAIYPYLVGSKRDRFMFFLRIPSRGKLYTASSGIWIWVSDLISYDSNRCALCASVQSVWQGCHFYRHWLPCSPVTTSLLSSGGLLNFLKKTHLLIYIQFSFSLIGYSCSLTRIYSCVMR